MSRFSPAASSRAITAACATAPWPSSAASISPGSMRKPRSFTCASARPRNSSTPSARQRARSPLRYIRLPAGPNGSATNRSAVSPARCRYPRASPAPAMYSSPATPAGTGRKPPSNTYTRVFQIGRPMGSAMLDQLVIERPSAPTQTVVFGRAIKIDQPTCAGAQALATRSAEQSLSAQPSSNSCKAAPDAPNEILPSRPAST